MFVSIRELLQEKDRAELQTIEKTRSVQDALDIMLDNDYTQLPVVNADGTLFGVISEHSIVATYSMTCAGQSKVDLLSLAVEHCVEKPLCVAPKDTIPEALTRLQTKTVLVVIEAERPVGILTYYDFTAFFREIAEGMVYVEKVERILRGYIESAFPTEKALKAALYRALGPDRRNKTEPAKQYGELSFGEHIQVMITEDNWGKFEARLASKEYFASLMEPVGKIRNKLAHFRGDFTQRDETQLRQALTWLQNRPKLSNSEADYE